MMSGYTPTTEEVRGDYAHFQIRTDVVYAVQDYATAEAEFDRWLSAHDAEVRSSVLAVQGEPEWEEHARPTDRERRHVVEDILRYRLLPNTVIEYLNGYLSGLIEENKPESTDGSER